MCEAAGCDRDVYARGLCIRHYEQLLRHGEVQPDRVASICAVPDCGRAAVTRGWCHGHYLRWSRTGDVRADVPLVRPIADVCGVEDCDRGAHSGGLCRSHARRRQVHGDPLAGGPLRSVTGEGSLDNGYWWVSVPAEQRHLVPPGRRGEFGHRLVMAKNLGRPLRPDETVHHRSGDRLDNRPEDPELWSTDQPKGQRVQDELAWVLDLLRRYDRQAALALGLDLEPTTGLPGDDQSPLSGQDSGLR